MTEIKPFLSLPFEKQAYRITEGFYYSPEETAIHGFKNHGGVDYALKRGTPVLAAAEGWAISSYFGFPVKRDNKRVLYKNKPIGFGLGYFVQVYHPEAKLYTAYGHLQSLASGLPFHKPRKLDENYWPTGHKINPAKLADYPFAKWVKRGEVIGFVGDSGLTWGYSDYPKRPDTVKHPSWDEVHLHFEVFIRIGSRRRKHCFDPYGIYSQAEEYPDSFRKIILKKPILWKDL